MHTCEPPIEVIEEWLASNETIRGTYGHLLLEQQAATDEDLIAAMRPYFESAHLDAREYFHRQIAIDLHPDADAEDEPTDLALIKLRQCVESLTSALDR
jgi:hypothetical protein